MVLTQREMQTVSSRIRTRVANSISYDINHYAKRAIQIQEKVFRIQLSSRPWTGYDTMSNFKQSTAG